MPLKLYSNLDHNDKARRGLYYQRHSKDPRGARAPPRATPLGGGYAKYSANYFSPKNIYGRIVYMYEIIIECIYSCCFGIRRRRPKLHDTIKNIEELTPEEFGKVMKFYRHNSCC